MTIYYAFEHVNGADSHKNKTAIGTLYLFRSEAARERWVRQGSIEYSLPGYRNFVVDAYAEKWLAGGGAFMSHD